MIKVNKLFNNAKISKIYKKQEDFEDPDRALKGILTNFVNEYFLRYDENVMNLLGLIFNVFKTALRDYKEMKGLDDLDIVFLYKGGNVLRIINNNVYRILPLEVTKIIDENYSKYLKQSDNDFGILINPKLENFQKIFNDMSILSYDLLTLIRSEYEKSPETYFYFFRLNQKEQNEALNNLLDNLNEDLPERNINSVDFYERSDGYITDDDNDNLVLYDIGRSKSMFYTTLNTSLDFGGGKNVRVKFDLARTKVSFRVNQGISSGELIDVSISHKDDSSLKKFKSVKEFRKFMSDNMILNKINDEYKFEYDMIGLPYIIKDLNNMLFIQSDLPWEKPKFEKRINRLMYFLLLESLNNMELDISSLVELGKDFRCLGSSIFDMRDIKLRNKYFMEFSKNIKKVGEKVGIDDINYANMGSIIMINFYIVEDILEKMVSFLKKFNIKKDLYEIDTLVGNKKYETPNDKKYETPNIARI